MTSTSSSRVPWNGSGSHFLRLIPGSLAIIGASFPVSRELPSLVATVKLLDFDNVRAKPSKRLSTRRARFELREVNILEDRSAFEKFKDEIPVVFIDGKKAFKFYFDEKRFVRRIQGNNH